MSETEVPCDVTWVKGVLSKSESTCRAHTIPRLASGKDYFVCHLSCCLVVVLSSGCFSQECFCLFSWMGGGGREQYWSTSFHSLLCTGHRFDYWAFNDSEAWVHMTLSAPWLWATSLLWYLGGCFKLMQICCQLTMQALIIQCVRTFTIQFLDYQSFITKLQIMVKKSKAKLLLSGDR